MAYIRQDVHGTSGQDILKINENFMNIFEKVFGYINFSDVDSELQKRINKQWIRRIKVSFSLYWYPLFVYSLL